MLVVCCRIKFKRSTFCAFVCVICASLIGRIMDPACLSVCLFVCPCICSMQALDLKTKSVEKPKLVSALRRCANFQFKKSKMRVRVTVMVAELEVEGRLCNMSVSVLGPPIFLVCVFLVV